MTDDNNGKPKPLKDLFAQVIKSSDSLESTPIRHDSDEYQERLKNDIQSWLDIKQIVTQLSLFSSNESTDDLGTAEIKYISIDYRLAQLYTEYTKPSKVINLKKSIILYLQFLRSLDDYRLLDKVNSQKLEKLKQSPFDITTLHETAMIRRDEKIANFKLERQLNSKLETLSKLESDETEFNNTDDELVRSLYFDQLKLFTIKSFDFIRLIAQELEILQNIPEPKVSEITEESTTDERQRSRADPTNFTEKLEFLDDKKALLSKQGKILKPFTLVKRDDLKKKVFGTGQYLPTMTVEEYLEQELANGGMVSQTNDDNDESSDEDDYEKNDRETYKKREWDEFTESHAKGSGNTMNRG